MRVRILEKSARTISDFPRSVNRVAGAADPAENGTVARLALHLALAPWVCMPIGLAACAGASEVDRLVGEVHLHQNPMSAYVHALFVDPPTPVAQARGDSALPTPPSLYEEGGCQAYEVRGCTGDCNTPVTIDAGEVEIAGLAREIKLRYQPMFGGYDDLVFDGAFLPGGAMVDARGQGRGKVPAWEGSVRLADPLQISSTLGAGLGGLRFDWSPGTRPAEIEALISVTPQGPDALPTRVIRCAIDDAAGELRVPDAALALMPAAPRVIQIETTRQELVRVALGSGLGVVLHGGYSVSESRSEP
jgi:hypothetical protein